MARLREELADRYGPVPEAVENLLRFSLLKSLAKRVGRGSDRPAQRRAQHQVPPAARIDPQPLLEVVNTTQGAQFTPAGVLRIPLAGLEAPEKMLAYLTGLLAPPQVTA